MHQALLSCYVERSETSSYFNADFAAKATENFVTLFDYRIGRSSWILRLAQNDKTPALQLFNLLAMKSALHKMSR